MLIGYVSYYVEQEDPLAVSPASDPQADTRQKELIESSFAKMDKNKDGVITAQELPRPQLFELLDGNHDGSVTKQEAIENFPDKIDLLKLLQSRKRES